MSNHASAVDVRDDVGSTLATARKAVDAGISVVPVRADGTKKSVGRWKEFQQRHPTHAELEQSFRDSRLGLACVCGSVSGGLEFLDFEEQDALEKCRSTAKRVGIEHLLQRVERGYMETTPGGGVHLAYRCSAIDGNQVLAKRKSGDVLVETRGEGGYCIVSPSAGGVHESGGAYQLLHGGLESTETITQEEREQLLAAIRSLDESPPKKAVVSDSGAAMAPAGRRPGDDFNRRASWADVLEPAGWKVDGEESGKTFWRRPGKGIGSSATTNHDNLDLLYVFSTSTDLEAQRWYTKFAAYTYLHHDGDFSASARVLSEDGYGGSKTDGGHDDSSGWPTPLREAAYHGLIGDIVKTILPHSEGDSAGILVQLLVAVGNVVGRHPHFVAEADKHYPNLFVTLVGETSKGRKGSSWGHIPRLFELAKSTHSVGVHPSINPSQYLTLNISTGLSSGEGLIWSVRDEIEGGKEPDPGVEDKRLVVVESEFASPLRNIDRQGNTLSPVIRNAWDTGDLSTLTKNSPAKSTGAHISIIGHVTKNELRRELNRTETANGFANRFLWVCVRRSKYLPDGGSLTDDAFQPLIQRLVEALRAGKRLSRMCRDAEAGALWHEVYPKLSAGKPGLLGAVTARAEAQVMRMACIYALMDGADVVRRPHLEAALEVWRYAEDSAGFIFGDAIGDPVADEILAGLRSAGEMGMSRTEIRDLFGRNRRKKDIGPALATLAELGLAYTRPEKTDGRPVERWFAVVS